MLSPGISSSMKSCAETVVSKHRGGRAGRARGCTPGKRLCAGGWRGRKEEIPRAWAEAGTRQLANIELERQHSGGEGNAEKCRPAV